jgi:hypothetical protein
VGRHVETKAAVAGQRSPSGSDWPRLAEAWGSLERDLALAQACGAPADRGLSQLALQIGGTIS